MQGDWYTEAEVPILWPPDANGQGTRSCVPQLRPSTAKQISSFFLKKKKKERERKPCSNPLQTSSLFHPLFNIFTGLPPFSLVPMCSDLSCSSSPLLPGFTLHGFVIQIAKLKMQIQ